MPRFDVICPAGHSAEVTARWDDRTVPCLICGEPTVRVWQTSCPNVVSDTFPGGSITIRNMSSTPETFTSKQAHRQRCKDLGLVLV